MLIYIYIYICIYVCIYVIFVKIKTNNELLRSENIQACQQVNTFSTQHKEINKYTHIKLIIVLIIVVLIIDKIRRRDRQTKIKTLILVALR